MQEHPKHLHYDPRHDSPTMLTTAIGSLIVTHWKDLFGVHRVFS